MGLILLTLLLQLTPVDSLAESLDPEHTTMAALGSLEELTSWLFLAQGDRENRTRLTVDLPRTRIALAGRGTDRREWSGYLHASLPGSVSLVAGGLRPSLGAGMILASPRFGSPETSGVSGILKRPRLGGYAATNGESRLRGLAFLRDAKPLFFGAFSGGKTRGAALEYRSESAAVGVLAVRSSSGRTKTEGWVRMRLGPAGIEAAASGLSRILAVRLSSKRNGPSLQLAARSYGILGPFAAPPRLRSGLGNTEQGLTMAGRWPAGSSQVTLAVDHSSDGSDVQDRTRLSIKNSTTDLRVDRRLRHSGSDEWRLLASHRIPRPPTMILSGFLASKGGLLSSYLRIRIQVEHGPHWQLDAGLVEFRTRSGGPVVAIYEASPDGAFPIARLTGDGRRVSLRITRIGRLARARLACSWHSQGARGALQGLVISSSCSFSLSG